MTMFANCVGIKYRMMRRPDWVWRAGTSYMRKFEKLLKKSLLLGRYLTRLASVTVTLERFAAAGCWMKAFYGDQSGAYNYCRS